jgi:hypothetical protein
MPHERSYTYELIYNLTVPNGNRRLKLFLASRVYGFGDAA